MSHKTKVFIDPTSNIWYSSFYIKGLYDIFGKKNVSFSAKYFGELKRKEEPHSYDHYMAFVIFGSDKTISKHIIDFRDKPSVKESAYNWCHNYAKVNFNLNLTDKRYHDKIISIPPGFGIKIWNIWETAFYFHSNLVKSSFSPLIRLSDYFNHYGYQYKRPILEELTKTSERSTNQPTRPYVFMIATLWDQANCIEGTNLFRKSFVEVCKASDCDFEGGFFASVSHPQYKEFKDIVFDNRYSLNSYVNKTRLSAFVFNTPAVHNCHGWKLGEYLAMGKAIISTPIFNQLPENLIHGVNIHFVSTIDELKQGVKILLEDTGYRKKLEDGAISYYEKYCKPTSVISRIIRDKD